MQIERIGTPSAECFRRDFVEPNRPVVLVDALRDWAALVKWTPEYLRERVGPKPVSVFAAPDGRFSGHFGTRGERLPFDQFLDLAFGIKPSDEVYYLQQSPLAYFSELSLDVTTPALVRPDLAGACNLWIGGRGATTVLHYDAQDNFLAQVHGRKEVTLFPPSELGNLYPFPVLSGAPHHSRVDIDAPDRKGFPRFRPERARHVSIDEGEMLFLPNCWWHQVRSAEPSISVNFFWRAMWQAWARAPMLRMLPSFGRFIGRRLLEIAREDAGKLGRRLVARAAPSLLGAATAPSFRRTIRR